MKPSSLHNEQAASATHEKQALLDELIEKCQLLQSANNRLEEALQESEEKFRIIFEHSPVGKSLTQINGNLRANTAFCKILGYSEKELNEIKWTTVTHPDDIKASKDIIDQLIKGTADTLRYEKRYIHKNGEIIWADVLTTLYKSKAGDPQFFITTIVDITSQKHIFEELKLSEERYRTYISLTGQIPWSTNAIGELVEEMPYFCEFTGLSFEQIKGTGWVSALHPDDVEPSLRAWNQAVINKTPYETEYRIRRYDGIYRKFLAKGFPLFNENNDIYSWTGICLDITDRKIAEDLAKENMSKFRSLVENIPQRVFLKNLKYQYEYINKEFASDLNIDASDAFGKNDYDLFSKEHADKYHQDDIEIIKTGETREFDEKYITDGEEKWIHTVKTPFRDIDGKIKGVLGIFSDITEKKQTEELLKFNENRFRELVDSLPQLIWTCQVDGPCDFLNKQWIEYTGIPEESQLGYGWLQQLHPEDQDRVVSEWLENVKLGGSFDIEFRIRRNDGVYHWFKTKAIPLRDSKGAITKWFGSNTDFDDIKQAEAELKKTLQNLKRSNEELEEFAYVASHDLQEPLRMVSSYTQLLERRYKDHLDQDASDFINFAVDGANRMQQLISDLLEYSRVTTKGKPFVKIDLSAVLGQAVANLYTKIQESGALIIKDELPFAYGDETQLVRVFQNLLDNAIKFKGVNAPRITVSSRTVNHELQILISDNGIGIDSIYKDRIFVIFQRLHNKTEYPGTGIGLAICKKIIERHNGKIWFESEPGHGTTFVFSLNSK